LIALFGEVLDRSNGLKQDWRESIGCCFAKSTTV
jgi:hypothetical protein